MSKITEYGAATDFDAGDVLLKDGTNGTKKITAENAAAALVSMAVDTTMSQAGKAADAEAVGEALIENIAYIDQTREKTRNINTAKEGRFGISAAGVIDASNNNYFGLSDKVACSPSTTYTITFHNIFTASNVHNIFYAFYDSSGSFISRDGTGNQYRAFTTITTPSNAYYICVADYRSTGISISDDSKIQIELGSKSTDYIPPKTSIDYIARELSKTDIVPNYFETQLDSAVSAIMQNMMAAGQNGDTFIFVTDCHWYNNQKHSPALINHILKNTNIKMVVNGGDIIQGHEATKNDAIEEIFDCIKAFQFGDSTIKTYTLFGNHDDNTNNNAEDTEAHLSQIELYALMFKSFESNNVKYGGHNYYYIDNDVTKIRYYFLDWLPSTMTAQAEWVSQSMSELPSGYDVVVFCHGIYRSQNVGGTYIFVMESQAVLDMFESYKENVICFVQGHAHMDGVFMAYDGAVPIIITDTDAMNPVGANVTATVGTVTEQCFDVFVINKAERTISCTRVGRGSDREISY